jgi:hypothetical protein
MKKNRGIIIEGPEILVMDGAWAKLMKRKFPNGTPSVKKDVKMNDNKVKI